MDWLILAWTLFVLVVYIGGYLFPASVGIYTANLSAVYAAVVILGVCAWARRMLAAKSPGSTSAGTPSGKSASGKKK